MSTSTVRVTADQLFRMPDDGFRYELVRGELRKMNPAGSEHGVVIMRLARRLANFVEEQGLGITFGAETGFAVARDPDTVRAPDIAFVSNGRIPEEGLPKAFWPGAPDLAVEVVSPADSVNEVDDKVEDWLQAGAQLVWVVNPRWRNVTVYRSPSDITTLNEHDPLDGAEVVPEFRCRVGEIFWSR